MRSTAARVSGTPEDEIRVVGNPVYCSTGLWDTFRRYPATLKVRHNGSLHLFERVADAESFMAMLDRSPCSASSEAGTPRVSFPTISDDERPSADTLPAPN